MATPGSVTRWMAQLDKVDQEAAQQIWTRFYEQLVAYARIKLNGSQRVAADEEDVVSSAFGSFFRRARDGQFPDVRNRDDLRHLLFAIVQRKAADHCRHSARQKRGGGKVLAEADLSTNAIEAAVDREPPAEASVIAHESIEHLMGCLNDELQAIALSRLQGYTNAEIAEQIDRSLPTVERRLRLIRDTWEEVIDE